MSLALTSFSFCFSPRYVACAEAQDVTGDCAALRVCVTEASTTIETIRQLLPEENIVPSPSTTSQIQALIAGDCNVIANDSSAIAASVLVASGYSGDYTVGTARFSKEPLALFTRQGDTNWSDFVYWIVQATFYAEENGITQSSASDMPTTKLYGPLGELMLQDAIRAVGNFGEIYTRGFGTSSLRSGLNLLNDNDGPQLYPLPGF